MWIWFRSTWAEGGSCNLTDIFALLERSPTSKQMTAVVLGHLFCPEREEAALGMRLTSGLTSFDRGVHRPTRSKEVVKWNILHVSLDAIFLPCIFVKKMKSRYFKCLDEYILDYILFLIIIFDRSKWSEWLGCLGWSGWSGAGGHRGELCRSLKKMVS